jgi:hypothetical protein
MENNAVRRLLLALGALAIVVASFFATLQILNSFDTPPTPATPAQARDAMRVQQVRALSAALEKYRSDRGKYPELPENDAIDLQRDLVGGGYLAEIPKDPTSAGSKSGYLYSSNGKTYGMMLPMEAGGRGIPAGGVCLVRAKGDHSTSFWKNPPECQF